VKPCDRIQSAAAGLASMLPSDPEREEAWAHARDCAACARALREAERLQAAIAEARYAPPLGTAARMGASQAIVSELHRDARRRRIATIASLALAFALCITFARQRASGVGDWTVALALLGGAFVCGAAATERRWAGVVVGAATAAVLAVALASRSSGHVAPFVGMHCLATEVACAAFAIVAGWWALHQGTTSLGPRTAAAGAAAGALAGAAALELTCSARDAVAHLLAFHVSGVLLSAAAAALVLRITVNRAWR
jgi:hypothetical protein